MWHCGFGGMAPLLGVLHFGFGGISFLYGARTSGFGVTQLFLARGTVDLAAPRLFWHVQQNGFDSAASFQKNN
ncbi:hypothetical protein HNO89_003435 [Sporosarcina luteola]|nr:hypothetical protein [Sporosarcina luteola]